MKTYTQGIYEGLKLALKIINSSKSNENIKQEIKNHMLLLDSNKFIEETVISKERVSNVNTQHLEG